MLPLLQRRLYLNKGYFQQSYYLYLRLTVLNRAVLAVGHGGLLKHSLLASPQQNTYLDHNHVLEQALCRKCSAQLQIVQNVALLSKLRPVDRLFEALFHLELQAQERLFRHH